MAIYSNAGGTNENNINLVWNDGEQDTDQNISNYNGNINGSIIDRNDHSTGDTNDYKSSLLVWLQFYQSY